VAKCNRKMYYELQTHDKKLSENSFLAHCDCGTYANMLRVIFYNIIIYNHTKLQREKYRQQYEAIC